jgi:arabinogalactan oligomer/maltooligosaccharide transport system permease protein
MINTNTNTTTQLNTRKRTVGRKKGSLLTKIIVYAILIVTLIAVIYPIYWILIGALNPGDSLYSATLFPKSLTFAHFTYLFTQTNYWIWYKNTLYVAVMNTIISTVLVITAAYALSRFRFKGRRYGLMTLLVLQMFPSFMGMIAIYVLLQQMTFFGPHGLLDNLWGLILVYAGGGIPYNVWLIKGYFDSIPKSIEEAAKIDGASHTKIFFSVMMPLARPMIVFVAITHFMGPWMDFIFPRLILTSDDKLTLAIGLYNMVNGLGNSQFSTFAAGAVLVAVPITILFLLFQKQLTEGLTAGANKG